MYIIKHYEMNRRSNMSISKKLLALLLVSTFAVSILEKSIKDSYREGTDRNDGVNFQKYLEMLTNE